MPVEIAAAGDRTLAADIEGGERVDLAGIGNADNHAELLLHGGIGGGWFHAAVFERRPLVLVETGQDLGGFDGFRREAKRGHCTHCAGRSGHGSAVFRDEGARDAVEGAHAVYVVLNNGDAGCPPRLDRLMQLVDGRLFETKRLALRTALICHDVARVVRVRAVSSVESTDRVGPTSARSDGTALIIAWCSASGTIATCRDHIKTAVVRRCMAFGGSSVELTLEMEKGLRAALDRAIAAAELEEA